MPLVVTWITHYGAQQGAVREHWLCVGRKVKCVDHNNLQKLSPLALPTNTGIAPLAEQHHEPTTRWDTRWSSAFISKAAYRDNVHKPALLDDF